MHSEPELRGPRNDLNAGPWSSRGVHSALCVPAESAGDDEQLLRRLRSGDNTNTCRTPTRGVTRLDIADR
eukprot:15431544-Alexandrium_andersonii.AAC.1